MNGMYFDGKGPGFIEVLFKHFLGGTEENHREPGRMAVA
jgi:hypothetical protein